MYMAKFAGTKLVSFRDINRVLSYMEPINLLIDLGGR